MQERWEQVSFIKVHFQAIIAQCKMKMTNLEQKYKVEVLILSHAGQMALLKNTKSRDLIQEMWDHEKAHLAKFEELLVEYQVKILIC